MKSSVISFTIGAMLASTFNSTIHSATEKVNDLGGSVKELGKTFKDPGTWEGLGAGLLSMDTLSQPFKTAIDFEQSMMNVKSVINSATSF
ncbi:MAG: hypothetical protein IJD28_00455 [Deferribacterales bacterium]|nr:hypothetical protein [Deferribacterales bacterium]